MTANRKVLLACALFVLTLALVGGGLYYDYSRSADARATVAAEPPVKPRYVGPPLAELTWPADAPLFVGFLGDSLTAGYNASTPDRGYRSLVMAELARYGPVAESGTWVPGARLQKVADIAPPLGEANRLIVVELGTNDAAEPSTPVEDFQNQYRDLLTRTRTTAPNTPIICLGTWLGPDSQGNTAGLDLDRAIRNECLAQGGIYLRLDGLFAVEDNRGPAGIPAVGDGDVSDIFHPNDVGHQRIAKQILGRVKLPERVGD